MMQKPWACFLAAALSVGGAPAEACVTGFSQHLFSINLAHVRVDPFGLVSRGDRGTVLLRLNALSDVARDERCAGLLRISAASAPDYVVVNGQGSSLRLDMAVDAQPGLPSTRHPDARIFPLSRAESALDAMVVEGLATGSGRFEGAFRLELMSETESEIVDVAELLISTTIPPAVSIRFDDATGPQRKTIDFGRLISGDSRHLTLHVAATTAYALAASSENGGFLVNRDAGALAYAPYDLVVDGRTISLGRDPKELATGDGSGRPIQQILDVGVALRDAPPYAGRYLDTVTFTVSSVY